MEAQEVPSLLAVPLLAAGKSYLEPVVGETYWLQGVGGTSHVGGLVKGRSSHEVLAGVELAGIGIDEKDKVMLTLEHCPR